MTEKIIIASDSTTDLGPELIEKYNIRILPLGVSLGEQFYKDGVDITSDDIYSFYEKNGVLPKTSAPNIGELTDFFGKLVSDGSSVIYFTISSLMSSSYSNACIAASEYDNIHVVDTKNLTSGGGLIVLKACEMVSEGTLSADVIAAKCRELTEKTEASFVVDSLEFLKKGGRCSSLAALGANLLSIKPKIVVKDGKMEVGTKYRGKFQAVLSKYIHELLDNRDDIDLSAAFVTHAGVDESVIEACIEEVKNTVNFENIYISHAGCTICSHCGKDTVGILFMRK